MKMLLGTEKFKTEREMHRYTQFVIAGGVLYCEEEIKENDEGGYDFIVNVYKDK